ncbi:hypothetical protein E3E11_04860 [Oecophyllibacter saccharovorans]|uniref:hypothetical protein n=1 Tax=Oecophyllibacter saccharovorans TaxID=2558360 RepID=UPI00114179E1|nr:hypothetical protein [Oecophyllibacter saccharovorans]QDH15290.1 hypothetical protein E3E11_04860 [Oecophyllibacter saccharovorans]
MDPHSADPHEKEEKPVVEVLPPQPGETEAQRMMREGAQWQKIKGIIPPDRRRLPSLWPWALLALLLVLISVGIELFWPLPGMHGPLPPCSDAAGSATLTSCQR